jgi:hypothetical protein
MRALPDTRRRPGRMLSSRTSKSPHRRGAGFDHSGGCRAYWQARHSS